MDKTNKLSYTWIAIIIIATVLVLDQALKIWVKTSFFLGESIEILPFFELKFIQNNGMAFGMELGSKLFLTLFRIIVAGIMFWYIVRLCRQANTSRGYLATLCFIAAGATGNIIDCLFYGEIFTNPMPFEVAQFVPWGEGYSNLFHGFVVDMLYFPLFSFQWPEWVPFLGGDIFSFFDPVFNIADAAISVGIVVLVLFYTKYLPFGNDNKKENSSSNA